MSAPGDDGARRAVYVLLDASGSTVTGGFAAGCEQAMPLLIDSAASRPGLLMSVLAYGTQADTLVRLSEPADIKLIPAVTPAGLSSLAAGLRLVAESVGRDAARLAADGIACLPPAVLVLADGLPTDPAAALLAARAELAAALAAALTATLAAALAETSGEAGAMPPVFAAPPGTDRLAVAGLSMTFEPLAPGTPGELAASVLAVFEHLLAGLAARPTS